MSVCDNFLFHYLWLIDRWGTTLCITWSRHGSWKSQATPRKQSKPYKWPWFYLGWKPLVSLQWEYKLFHENIMEYLNWHTYHFLKCLMYSACFMHEYSCQFMLKFWGNCSMIAQGRDPCQRKGRFWTSVPMTGCLCSWSWRRPTRHWEKRSVTIYNSRTITST